MTNSTAVDKLKRIIAAKEKDELPLVQSLKKLGYDAFRNAEGSFLNMTLGDVICKDLKSATAMTRTFSFESQVASATTKHVRFSYTAKKVEKYVGAGAPEDSYVLLGCYDQNKTDMVFAIAKAVEFHEMLRKTPQGVFLNTTGNQPFYIVSPAAIASSIWCVVGSTIEEVTIAWDAEIQKKF